jgi:hypothetical protein
LRPRYSVDAGNTLHDSSKSSRLSRPVPIAAGASGWPHAPSLQTGPHRTGLLGCATASNPEPRPARASRSIEPVAHAATFFQWLKRIRLAGGAHPSCSLMVAAMAAFRAHSNSDSRG